MAVDMSSLESDAVAQVESSHDNDFSQPSTGVAEDILLRGRRRLRRRRLFCSVSVSGPPISIIFKIRIKKNMKEIR